MFLQRNLQALWMKLWHIAWHAQIVLAFQRLSASVVSASTPAQSCIPRSGTQRLVHVLCMPALRCVPLHLPVGRSCKVSGVSLF
jgi:hypothetical protein